MPGAFVRQIDELGRVVIPAEVRRRFGIVDGSGLEFFLNEDLLILRPYAPGCWFCGSVDDLKPLHDRFLCATCATEAAALFDLVPQGHLAMRGQRDRPIQGDQPVPGDVRDWVGRELASRGWRVDVTTGTGRAVDFVASTSSRTWYVQVKECVNGSIEWPSGHRIGWLKGAARRQAATPVLAFVRGDGSARSAEFWSAHARRRLDA